MNLNFHIVINKKINVIHKVTAHYSVAYTVAIIKIHFYCKLQGHARNYIEFLIALGEITIYNFTVFHPPTVTSLRLFYFKLSEKEMLILL